ncbi:MAG: hypothetical protein IT450_17430 [Phycisphaerales bacterium]|nr:hypothetical protein [Phycisphaerales bacterium]
MNGKRFLVFFFATAIAVAALAAWLGMKGLSARDLVKARAASTQPGASQPASSPVP